MGFFRSWLTEKVTDIEIEELRANEIIKTASPSELYNLINSSNTSDTAKRIYKSKMKKDYPNWSPSSSFSYSSSYMSSSNGGSKKLGKQPEKQPENQPAPYANGTGSISKDWVNNLEDSTRDSTAICTRCNRLLPPNVIYCASCGKRYVDSSKDERDCSKTIVSKTIAAKNIISFGNYYYGDKVCPIKWLVLGVNNQSQVVLLSAYALEAGNHPGAINWVKNDFLKSAFTVEERKHIQTSSLLSINQIKSYFKGKESLECKPTIRAEKYAMSTFCERTCGYMQQEYSGNCMWWLDDGSIVDYKGEISKNTKKSEYDEIYSSTISYAARLSGNNKVTGSGLRGYVIGSSETDGKTWLKNSVYIRPVITVDKGYLSFVNGIRDKSYLVDPKTNQVVPINKGCTIQLGNYKGEVVDWVYINGSKGKVLLLSKKIIEGIYDVSNVDEWLNNDFYSTAFSEQEKTVIIANDSSNSMKKVSLIGKQDISLAKKYLGDDFCVATYHVIKSCALSTGKCKWVLDDLSFINFRGVHQSKKNLAGCVGIRPAIWVDYSELIQLLQSRLDPKHNSNDTDIAVNGDGESYTDDNKSILEKNIKTNSCSKICKNCGYTLDEKMIYCPICGEKYYEKIECCGYEITKEMRFCPICGKKIR